MSTSSSTPNPSLSRAPPSAPQPQLVHSLYEEGNSILCVAADEKHIFSGGQTETISVWSKETYKLVTTLEGHTGSVTCLEHAKEKNWLFSASGDSTVRIWSSSSLSPLYILNPYMDTEAGDLFSIVWCPPLQTLYIGCQNTSIQWFDFNTLRSGRQPLQSEDPVEGTPNLSRKVHKFWDSYPHYEHKPADIFAHNSVTPDPELSNRLDIINPSRVLNVLMQNVINSAHYGYVYCMAILPSIREGSDDLPLKQNDNIQLITGSGDETVKLWYCTRARLAIIHTFECNHGAVLSLVGRGDTIYAGCQEGYVKILDLDTRTVMRTLIIQESVDILALTVMHSEFYACGANGQVQRWTSEFNCTASWVGHEGGIVLSAIMTKAYGTDDFCLITGANDGYIKVWQVDTPLKRNYGLSKRNFDEGDTIEADSSIPTGDTLVYALSKFISIPSVSGGSSRNAEACQQAGVWLTKCLTQLGAASTLLSTGEKSNPLVLAKFTGNEHNPHKPKVLFYGHYDVVGASSEGWQSDPFKLVGKNGFLYGRGVTDDKGPVLAIAFAASELLVQRALGLDLVLLIEGEEEAGSIGFEEAVRKYKDQIGPVNCVLVSNSTWIAEETPCITYGLRGVVHCNIKISNGRPDVHSGIEGGRTAEPMNDMIKILSKLTDDQRRVLVPGFYETVLPLTDEEKALYQKHSELTGRALSALASQWREPSLTVHNIKTSGPTNATVIPGTVECQVSVRIVPDQDLQSVANSLIDRLKSSFESLQSPNKIEVTITRTANWWLGKLDNAWFRSLETAVMNEWGVEPLRIREGGSIPSVPFLEKEFGCGALHLPLGQSTDQAHLPNERISLTNLRRGKSVFAKFLRIVADKDVRNQILFSE